MTIEEAINNFMKKLDTAIDTAMQTTVAESTKQVISATVSTEVYDEYNPTEYVRRETKSGGLADESVMEVDYSPAEKLLTVTDMSKDDDTGRLIAPVVESGRGYTWKKSQIYKHPFPRPFHSVAQERMMQYEIFKDSLDYSLKKSGFTVT